MDAPHDVAEVEQQSSTEYEREPVPEKALLGFKSFIGMYAGEHCAGTELMIGPLFVAAGVSALDVIGGLIIGNALAVLCWVILCAPIATRARLTLYYQLEKICGRNLVTLYNLANGVMFCFLAGAMITVSATALGVWFKFPMPELNDIYPNSIGWVVAVLAVGSVIAVVAALRLQQCGTVRQYCLALDGSGVPGFRHRSAQAVHRRDGVGPLVRRVTCGALLTRSSGAAENRYRARSSSPSGT